MHGRFEDSTQAVLQPSPLRHLTLTTPSAFAAEAIQAPGYLQCGDGAELSSAESQVLRHPSSGNVHHLIFANESTVSRVYRSKADLIYSVGDIPQQELQARPLVRDAGHESCPSDAPCNRLNAECLTCKFNYSCVYGEEVAVMCQPKSGIKCIDKSGAFERKMICRYCYQTANSEHTCDHNSTCQVNSAPRQRYIATCNVRPDVLCLGRRQFHKNLLCNWTRGYSWWTALVLSCSARTLAKALI
ncbi:TM2 domain-containing protein 3 almondex isoform X3 [Dermacentor variabilis]|uniref:TM2 domain-containing protein 3 almondex isoform X3 n=1 Tax=Dermacentor variabilis TaxID=34621 RepID=UPI003F5B69E8